MTLVEVMMAVGIGALLLAVIAALSSYTARSSVAVVNYGLLNAQTRAAVDSMSKKIRQASAVTAFSPQEVALVVDGVPVRYRFESAQRALLEYESGHQRRVLEDVESLQFQLFQRNAVSGSFDQVPAGASAQAGKLLQISWRAAKRTAVTPEQTDSLVSMKIVLRAK